jgi:hypothetical protein
MIELETKLLNLKFLLNSEYLQSVDNDSLFNEILNYRKLLKKKIYRSGN